MCYISGRKKENTTGEANITCATTKLICVATETDKYYPVNLLDYKATEMLIEGVPLQISGSDLNF